MGWLKAKKIIQAKPYIIDPYRSNSLKRARQLWRQTGYPSDESLMNTARVIAESNKGESITPYTVKPLKASLPNSWRYVYTFRRAWIVTCSVALILVLFFSISSPGRALAKNIYDTVTRIVENILYIRPSDSMFPDDTAVKPENIPEANDGSESSMLFSNMTEAKEYIGKRLVYLDTSEYNTEKITANNSPISEEVLTLYSNADSTKISISQLWPQDDSDLKVTVDIDNSDYHSIESSLGFTIDGALTEDNIYVGYAIINDSIFTISIESRVLDWDMIISILNELLFL